MYVCTILFGFSWMEVHQAKTDITFSTKENDTKSGS